MFYVYILKSLKDGSIYTGYTNDLRRRFIEHNTNKNRATKYKTPFDLVYYEAYKSKSDAKHRESMLKKFGAGHKELKNSLEMQSVVALSPSAREQRGP